MQNQLLLTRDCSELQPFPHIVEFAFKKINTIQIDSFKKDSSEFLRIYYVAEGRFNWMINEQQYILYPGDLAVVLPGCSFGAEKNCFDIGTVSWIHLQLQKKD